MKALAAALILLMVILVIVSVKTVIPDSSGRLNLAGYRTCCPFAPASTAIGLAVVIILFFVGRKMTML